MGHERSWPSPAARTTSRLPEERTLGLVDAVDFAGVCRSNCGFSMVGVWAGSETVILGVLSPLE